MKNCFKKIITFVLVISVLSSLFVSPVCATNIAMQNHLSQFDQETVNYLNGLGYCDADIIKILEFDELRAASINNTVSIASVTLPSNPKEGDYVYEYVTLTKKDITDFGYTASDILFGMALELGVSALALSAVAAEAADRLANNEDFSGINFTFMWYYGVTNDLTIGWTKTLQNWVMY